MKTRTKIIIATWLIALILSACGPSQAEKDAQLTQIAAYGFATQTALAPTSTSTPEPTATATLTPTATPTPTASPTNTPNAVLTDEAATMEAIMAKGNVEATAKAVSIQETQQAEDALWTKLANDGSITMKKGDLNTVDDFEESWAQRGWYQWWWFGYEMSNFVIKTHIDWRIPPDSFSDISGCGFVLRLEDENNHLVLVLTPSSSAFLGQMTPNGFQNLNAKGVWINPDWEPTQGETGSADFMVVAEQEEITAFINGVKSFRWVVARTNSGDIGYTIISGTNKDFGTSCKMTNTRIWELVK